MALPQDGQDANGLTKVTQIPAGKELMFIDPTTNEGGIITLEDLTKQILNGLASQAFALDAGQMTLPAAFNYLYGNKLSKGNLKIDWLYYSDTESSTIGGLTACVKDAVDNNKIPKEGIFFCFFTCRLRYLMLGYRYENGKFGTIILYGFDNNTYRYNIKNGVFLAS